MSPLYLQDGELLIQDGALAANEACCCCVCPAECVDGLQISLGNSPACVGGGYSDFLACAGGQIFASMYCSEGHWFVFVSVCCFENAGLCSVSYEAVLECEEDGLPPAGAVNLIQTAFFEEDDGCPPLPPTVTIIK